MNSISASAIPNGHHRAADSAALNRAADRAAVNKANAQKSTGPRTDSGKQRSSLNALRHGLTGQTVVLPADDLAAYQCHAQSFRAEYQPKGATEAQCVQSLIDLSWRLNRAAAAENNLLSLGMTEYAAQINTELPQAHDALAMALAFREHNRTLANISMYCHRLHRIFERTLAQLRDLQAERRNAEQRQLDEAARMLKMHKAQDLPYHPVEDGFVFSTDEIETHLRRQHRSEQANHHSFYSRH